MIGATRPETMTDYDREEFEQQRTVIEMQTAHTQRIKELELQVQILESKWSIWLKVPVTIVKLPLLILFGIAYICSMFTKKAHSEEFWKVLK